MSALNKMRDMMKPEHRGMSAKQIHDADPEQAARLAAFLTANKSAIVDEMVGRIMGERDPLTGEPFKTCAPHSVSMKDGGPVCDGCGKAVRLDAAGAWEHA